MKIFDENINRKNYQNKEYQNACILLPTFMENGEIETDKGNITFVQENSQLFMHNCNTDEGSSGGPVILIDNFSVIGMHKGHLVYNKKNVGIFIKNIIKDIKNDNMLKINSNSFNNLNLMKENEVKLQFQVKCDKTILGEKIYIIGNILELGNWSIEKSQRLYGT